jgi:hemerythrin-like domain-containing protein
MKITEALLAEHQVFHSLFDHVDRMLPRLKTLAEIKTLARLLEAALRDHSQAEDDLLLEPLEHCIEQLGQSGPFHQEHEEIDHCLLQVQKCRESAKARKLLLAAVQASRIHFNKEERIVFPLAEKSLSPRTLQNLGAAWARRREG